MEKFGACFVGCGEMVQIMGQKCIDIESATNESLQSEDGKLASPMEVDDEKSPDETQKSNSNIIECFKSEQT